MKTTKYQITVRRSYCKNHGLQKKKKRERELEGFVLFFTSEVEKS